ncbi:PPOX class F420-dependent oxidoreductase [Actinomadura atramentaria]|uniref:PPOX class F420-dependent oxidoreductase n=1 Tax=Actinomadura atramentaria TaxID=1990 RepID=UPI0003606299|nr:PPOX class F420-dependent oxidoreductase [Actinomadura atramentaria]
MTLNETERAFVDAHDLARLATIAPNGAPQNKPVGFRYNAELGTIDIHGFAMPSSAKYRNVQVNPEVAVVIDSVVGEGAEGVRFLEVRGRAETAVAPDPDEHLSDEIIRVRPRRLTGWNVDPERPGPYARNVGAAEAARS